MTERKQCRHVRHGVRAATTVHHLAIPGATSAKELDTFVELCALCSSIEAAYMVYVMAEDPELAKKLLKEALSKTFS